jgi:hypothetical protein
VVWTIEPLVPVIVSVYVPPGVDDVVTTLSELVPLPPIMVDGVKVAVAPVGTPETVSATSDVNPLDGVTVTVYVAVPPGVTD